MEFLLVLFEDPELVATEQQHKEAVQRVGEYAMGLVGDGTLKGGAPLHPVAEAKKVRTREEGSASWTVRSPRPRRSSRGTSSLRHPTSSRLWRSPPGARMRSSARSKSARSSR